MLNRLLATMAAILLVVPIAMAAAAPLPYKTSASHAYQDKLYGYGTLDVGDDGQGRIIAHFSNSRKWEGSKRVGMTVRIKDENGLLVAVSFTQDLPDPLFRGGTVERTQVKSVVLPPEVWATVTEVTFDFVEGIQPWECDFLKGKAKINPHIYFNEALCP
jgi:hypothetical protein